MLKKRYYAMFLALVLSALLLLSGCGGKTKGQIDEGAKTDAAAKVQDQPADTAQVADSSEMSQIKDVVTDDMSAVTADQLEDGVYDIKVDSSSSMFNITECKLAVQDGKMTAVMTMGGKGYLYVYMGTGEEAAKASETDYIPYEEKSTKEHTYTVPVKALDMGIDCAAFSKKREKWYDRTLVFRADSLPDDALKEGMRAEEPIHKIEPEDGEYSVSITLEGGSGRASVESPAKLTVEDGKASVRIIWSSSNFDYMIVDGEKYLNESEEGNSVFTIPVTGYQMSVIADTTAMSTPHEIAYTLSFGLPEHP